MDLSVVIPAQETNKYDELGDLAKFGDTTLLEWKITQFKEFVDKTNIYIASDSETIKNIASAEEVNYIERGSFETYGDLVTDIIVQVPSEVILWASVTSPFISPNDYKSMLSKFKSLEKCDSLVSSLEKYEYAYYNNEKLNFTMNMVPRNELIPIKLLSNGCYIVKKDKILKNNAIYGDNPYLYNLDYLSALEIKDFHTYEMSKELITIYFKRLLNV